MEDSCYNVQVKEENYFSCHSSYQLTTNEENYEKKILDNQMGMLVKSYQELPLEIYVVHAEVVPYESVQEYCKYFFL